MSFEGVLQTLLSPLVTALLLMAGAGVLALARLRRFALALAIAGFGVLWVCSTPWLAYALNGELASRYPPLPAKEARAADAIIVLGGAIAGTRGSERPTLQLGSATSRVWYAAALYREGKAPKIIVAAGNKPQHADEQIEADAIAEVLVQLGVPREALVLERTSTTTRENAANTLALARKLGARRALLVTSAEHMPRAMATFGRIWGGQGPELIPAPTAAALRPATNAWELWFPSLTALIVVTTGLKEFAGMAALAIIQ